MDNCRTVIGIDLHGTLLNRSWRIEPSHKGDLLTKLCSLKEYYSLFICTGNDLEFLKKYLPDDLSSLFDGFILENGSVYSDGHIERLLIDQEQELKIQELSKIISLHSYKELMLTARRLATIRKRG